MKRRFLLLAAFALMALLTPLGAKGQETQEPDRALSVQGARLRAGLNTSVTFGGYVNFKGANQFYVQDNSTYPDGAGILVYCNNVSHANLNQVRMGTYVRITATKVSYSILDGGSVYIDTHDYGAIEIVSQDNELAIQDATLQQLKDAHYPILNHLVSDHYQYRLVRLTNLQVVGYQQGYGYVVEDLNQVRDTIRCNETLNLNVGQGISELVAIDNRDTHIYTYGSLLVRFSDDVTTVFSILQARRLAGTHMPVTTSGVVIGKLGDYDVYFIQSEDASGLISGIELNNVENLNLSVGDWVVFDADEVCFGPGYYTVFVRDVSNHHVYHLGLTPTARNVTLETLKSSHYPITPSRTMNDSWQHTLVKLTNLTVVESYNGDHYHIVENANGTRDTLYLQHSMSLSPGLQLASVTAINCRESGSGTKLYVPNNDYIEYNIRTIHYARTHLDQIHVVEGVINYVGSINNYGWAAAYIQDNTGGLYLWLDPPLPAVGDRVVMQVKPGIHSVGSNIIESRWDDNVFISTLGHNETITPASTDIATLYQQNQSNPGNGRYEGCLIQLQNAVVLQPSTYVNGFSIYQNGNENQYVNVDYKALSTNDREYLSSQLQSGTIISNIIGVKSYDNYGSHHTVNLRSLSDIEIAEPHAADIQVFSDEALSTPNAAWNGHVYFCDESGNALSVYDFIANNTVYMAIEDGYSVGRNANNLPVIAVCDATTGEMIYDSYTNFMVSPNNSDYSQFAFSMPDADVTVKVWLVEGVVGDGCNIVFNLVDSYGDGWSDNYLVVSDNYGTAYELTIESGNSATYTFNYESGTHIALSWIMGSWINECSFTVSYADGTVIYESEGIDADFSFGFDVDCDVTPSEHAITATANPTNGGIVTGAGTYLYNQTCTLTATANAGYTFLYWAKDGEAVTTETTYSFTVSADADYVAYFAPESSLCLVTFNLHDSYGDGWNDNYLVVTDGNGIAQQLTIIGNDTLAVYGLPFLSGSHLALSWIMGSWTNECSFTVSYADGTLIYEATTIEEGFTYGFDVDCGEPTPTYYTITAMASPTEGGNVFGAGIFAQGETCILTARANAGYTFVNWITVTGAPVSTNSTYTFTVTENADFVANFEQAGGETTQTTNITSGWNWWSTYVEADDLFAQLKTGLGANAQQIKSSTSFVNYYGTMWIGGLSSINNESCYLINANNACTFEMTGNQAMPANHPITINPNWNWIGYPNTGAQSVANAFSNFTPANGDQVKSQNAFSTYYSGMWVGGLSTITPGMGLLYKSNSTGAMTLIYPEPNRSEEVVENVTNEDNHWTADYHAYPSNMTVMAVIELDEVELQGEHYELAAFANGECRGSAKLMFVEPPNRHIAFLTVVGDEASELRFSLYNDETGTVETQSLASLQYETNAIVGNLETPYVVRFRSTTGMDEWANSINVFPNPVNRGEQFSLGLPAVETRRATSLQIVNALGVVVETVCTPSLQSITAPKEAGIYTLRITVEGKGTCYRKLVVR